MAVPLHQDTAHHTVVNRTEFWLNLENVVLFRKSHKSFKHDLILIHNNNTKFKFHQITVTLDIPVLSDIEIKLMPPKLS